MSNCTEAALQHQIMLPPQGRSAGPWGTKRNEPATLVRALAMDGLTPFFIPQHATPVLVDRDPDTL